MKRKLRRKNTNKINGWIRALKHRRDEEIFRDWRNEAERIYQRESTLTIHKNTEGR